MLFKNVFDRSEVSKVLNDYDVKFPMTISTHTFFTFKYFLLIFYELVNRFGNSFDTT